MASSCALRSVVFIPGHGQAMHDDVAAGSSHNSVNIFDTRSARLRTCLVENDSASVTFLGFDASSRRLLAVENVDYGPGRLRVRECSHGPTPGPLSPPGNGTSVGRYPCIGTSEARHRDVLAASSDGATLACVAHDDKHNLRVCTNTKETVLGGHDHQITCAAFSNVNTSNSRTNCSTQRQLIATGARDWTVKVWEALCCIQTLCGHTDTVSCVAFNRSSTRIGSGDESGGVRVWNVQTGECNVVMNGTHARAVTSVAFNLVAVGEECVLTGSWDNSAKLWCTRHGTVLATLCGHTSTVRAVCFRRDGKLAATASDDGTVRLYDVSPGFEFWQHGRTTLHCVPLQCAVWAVLLVAYQQSSLGGAPYFLPPEMWLAILGYLRSTDFSAAVLQVRWGAGAGSGPCLALDATVKRRRSQGHRGR